MRDLNEQIKKFRENPLSSEIIKGMMPAYEAFGRMDGVMANCSIKKLLFEGLWINELRYRNALMGHDYDYNQIICAIACKNSGDKLKRQYEIIRQCINFVDDKSNKYSMLPVPDLLRINASIKDQTVDYLQDIDFAAREENTSELLWKFLNNMYSPENLYPEFLEMALAAYQIENIDTVYAVDLITRDILFSAYLKQKRGLSYDAVYLGRYYLLSDDLKDTAVQTDIECYVIALLEALKLMFNDITDITVRLQKEWLLLCKMLNEEFNKPYELSYVLNKSFYFRNADLEQSLSVTSKTAISYLKQMETKDILISQKMGRERIYINQRLLKVVEDGV